MTFQYHFGHSYAPLMNYSLFQKLRKMTKMNKISKMGKTQIVITDSM